MGTDVVGTGLPWVEAIAESFEPHDFVPFHQSELPALSACHGHLVIADLAGVPSLAFCTDDGVAFTWVVSEDGVRVVEGDAEAATVVELSERTFSEFVAELLTASGAVRTGRARVTRGVLGGWQRWEPAIQSLCSGREIYSVAVWETLVNRVGDPLDLHHAFAADDDVDEMRHFLDRAGYLHIKAVFTAEEVERYSAEVEHAVRTPGRAIRSRGGRSTLTATRSSPASTTSAGTLGCSKSSRTTRGYCASLDWRARTCASATTDSTDRWYSSSIPTS